jgi:hypothetical protein
VYECVCVCVCVCVTAEGKVTITSLSTFLIAFLPKLVCVH